MLHPVVGMWRARVFGPVVVAIALIAHGALADDKQRALELFKKSDQAYKQGRFQDSVDLLLEARKLQRAPVLLYDLGRAYEALGKPAEAADAYAAYLAEDEHAADRRAIEGRIATLRAQAAELARARERSDAPAPAPPPPAPPPEPPRTAPPPPVWPWAVAGIGALTLASGVVVGAAAKSAHDDAVSEPVQTEASSRQSHAESLARAATIVMVAGGAIAAIGLGFGIYLSVGPTGTVALNGSVP